MFKVASDTGRLLLAGIGAAATPRAGGRRTMGDKLYNLPDVHASTKRRSAVRARRSDCRRVWEPAAGPGRRSGRRARKMGDGLRGRVTRV